MDKEFKEIVLENGTIITGPVEFTVYVKKDSSGWKINGKDVSRAEYWKAMGADPNQSMTINNLPATVHYILYDLEG